MIRYTLPSLLGQLRLSHLLGAPLLSYLWALPPVILLTLNVYVASYMLQGNNHAAMTALKLYVYQFITMVMTTKPRLTVFVALLGIVHGYMATSGLLPQHHSAGSPCRCADHGREAQRLESVKRASVAAAAAAENDAAALDGEDGHLAAQVSWKPTPKSPTCGLRVWRIFVDISKCNGRVLGWLLRAEQQRRMAVAPAGHASEMGMAMGAATKRACCRWFCVH